ncbi:MAG: peptidoglycan glycosyltransferase [Eubacterium sp.]|jgi:stage V sporulation protein D (sporulation-specific penicillin-binding protein)|nr:peptidoglycan glycosyltransferase [Eubacterium sp.]
MNGMKTHHRKKVVTVFFCVFLVMLFLAGRLVYLMVFQSVYYSAKAQDLHERERDIKAARGKILDINGKVLASNRSVCTISVIRSQIKDAERVIEVLCRELEMEEETVRKRVEKYSSIERIKSNVSKETGDKIRDYKLDGVKVDEDYKRYYVYDSLASKVLGFTGGDNQGIIGLEVVYDDKLMGKNGKILTLTDARGVEIADAGESRLNPVDGNNLRISLDYNIQMYAQQAAEKAMQAKEADSVSIIIMKPSNGEILAMTNLPEFNLNDPYTLPEGVSAASQEEKQNLLNQMWRNGCINDTYEPGSTFKVITASAALEAGVVSLNDNFFCPGYKIVEDRRIRCARTSGHGAQSFVQGLENSCNPVFIELGMRLGADQYYKYFKQFGLLAKTGIDLPGEARTIMHEKKNIGQVELATVSFGQSFQITPVQLAATISSLINGGRRVTPHFGVQVEDQEGNAVEVFDYEPKTQIVSEKTSETMRFLLEKVVSEGGGKNAYIEGYQIGGKTATSQTLPRSAHRYISSFMCFAPASDPQVLCLVIINNPTGVYYGGTIAAPVAKELFLNILPYLGLERDLEAVQDAQDGESGQSIN